MSHVIARTDGYALLLPINLSTDARDAWLFNPVQIKTQEVVIGLRRDFPIEGKRCGACDRTPNPGGLAIAYLSAYRSIPAAEEDCGLSAPHGIAATRPCQGRIVHGLSERGDKTCLRNSKVLTSHKNGSGSGGGTSICIDIVSHRSIATAGCARVNPTAHTAGTPGATYGSGDGKTADLGARTVSKGGRVQRVRAGDASLVDGECLPAGRDAA